MYEVYALKYGERDTNTCQFFYRDEEMLAGFDRIHELAGKEKLIVAGHDPLVADRFKQVEPGIIKIA